MLALFVVMPLIIAAFIALLGNELPEPIKYIALVASLISLALVLVVGFNAASSQSTTWFYLIWYQFQITTSTAPLNMLLLLIVAVMTPLVITYSIGFMRVPSEQSRYYFETCIFAAAMMLFAIAGDFITMLMGWGLLSLASYLLIGFWHGKDGASSAARKAVTVALIGDVFMMIAVVMVWDLYHTFSFAAIISAPAAPAAWLPLLFVLIAAFAKSAQFPFNEWLPDAMEGPTPTSAFLHSSTMVKAGVFVVAVLLPLFAKLHLLNVILFVGIVTTIIGVTNALTETRIKRILAYSTIEDLGLMFIALGLNAVVAAMMLFVVQTFYKSLLFMSAGAIMKANDDEDRIDLVQSGAAGKPLLIATVIGVLSIAGIFPLSGFFGKASVYASAATDMPVYLVLLAVGFASSVYIFRWLLLPLKKPAAQQSRKTANFSFIPMQMLLPIYVLAALVVGASLACLRLPSYLSAYGQAAPLSLIGIAAETIVAVLGIAVAYVYFKRGAKKTFANRLAQELFYNGVFVNAFYASVAGLVVAASSAVDALDYELYRFVKMLAGAVLGFAEMLRHVENGQANSYMLVFLLGILAMVIIFAVVML